MISGLPIVLWVSLAVLTEDPPAPSPGSDPCAPASAWTWVESCHVLRGHQLSDLGTYGSFLVAGDNQTILSPRDAGKNRTGYTYAATLKQNLWPDAAVIAYLEGGTFYTLDHIVQDRLGTNGLARPADAFLSRLFVLQDSPGYWLQVAFGRLLLPDFFDTNADADCEITHFVSSSLVQNPTIPFPAPGMGLAAKLAPTSWLYVQGGAADASAVATQADFDTAFQGFDNTFGIFELGLSPFRRKLPGTYRFILWYEPSSGRSGAEESRANHGFAVSFDHAATKTLSLFLRYGAPDAPVNGLSDFWSVGAHLDKPFPGRDHDFVQAGLARGRGTLHTETLVEIGYSLHMTNDLSLMPTLQILDDPAENPRDGTFVLAGLRAVYVF